MKEIGEEIERKFIPLKRVYSVKKERLYQKYKEWLGLYYVMNLYCNLNSFFIYFTISYWIFAQLMHFINKY